MNIRQFSRLQNGVYTVTIKTEDWSEHDKLLMARYGEPSIDLGGEFNSDDPYVWFDLSSNLVLIMSESAFTQGFDSRDYADAEDRANLWKTDIVSRLVSEITIMRAQEDGFTQEEVETV